MKEIEVKVEIILSISKQQVVEYYKGKMDKYTKKETLAAFIEIAVEQINKDMGLNIDINESNILAKKGLDEIYIKCTDSDKSSLIFKE